jgi:hypothetical protein
MALGGEDGRRDPLEHGRAEVLVAITVPLALVALAYLLWAVSDRLLSVGPFDRTTFGWLIVVPVWLAAPIAAGFAARGLEQRERRLATAALGMVVAGLAAFVLWQARAIADCQFGARQDAASWALQSIAIGALVGAGFGPSAVLVGRFVQQQRPWRAVAAGAAAGVALLFVDILVVALVILGSDGCQRPPL